MIGKRTILAPLLLHMTVSDELHEEKGRACKPPLALVFSTLREAHEWLKMVQARVHEPFFRRWDYL